MVSLQRPTGEDGDTELGDMIADTSAEDITETVGERMRNEALERALDVLTPRTRRIVELRYGLGGGEPMLLEAVGREALGQVLGALPDRERQVLVLRTLASCGDTYELAHHITISRNAGIGEDEIAAFQSGAGDGLTDFDRVLIQAADELKRDQDIGEATWALLAERYSSEQLMEVVFVVGCYLTMAMLTKTFGMQLE